MTAYFLPNRYTNIFFFYFNTFITFLCMFRARNMQRNVTNVFVHQVGKKEKNTVVIF